LRLGFIFSIAVENHIAVIEDCLESLRLASVASGRSVERPVMGWVDLQEVMELLAPRWVIVDETGSF